MRKPSASSPSRHEPAVRSGVVVGWVTVAWCRRCDAAKVLALEIRQRLQDPLPQADARATEPIRARQRRDDRMLRDLLHQERDNSPEPGAFAQPDRAALG